MLFVAVRGDLGRCALAGGDFHGSVQTCLTPGSSGRMLSDTSSPDPGRGCTYLLRRYGHGECTINSWSTGSPPSCLEPGTRDRDLG